MKKSIQQTARVFSTVIPILVGVLLLVNLIETLLRNQYQKWFSGNILLDPLIGAFAGSISFGIPVTSYIVGGELLEKGVTLGAVTAFIMAWTTVGLVMMPLESSFFGKRFTLLRNGVNFIFAIIIAIAVVISIECIT